MTRVTIEDTGKVYEFIYKLITNTISGKIPWKEGHHQHGGYWAVMGETIVHVAPDKQSTFDLAIERKDPRSCWTMIALDTYYDRDGFGEFNENVSLLRGAIGIYRNRVRHKEDSEAAVLHLEMMEQAMSNINTTGGA